MNISISLPVHMMRMNTFYGAKKKKKSANNPVLTTVNEYISTLFLPLKFPLVIELSVEN